MSAVICAECGSEMELRQSPKYKSPFWGCSKFPVCRGTHGAHPDGRPLGVPANAETKQWRIKAHSVFDTIWICSQINMTRKKAYKLLAQELGEEEVHIGESDIEKCKKIIAAAETIIGRLGE
jgi:ssDNA-binding Zn-finger/Zn-ribbon topoisomerase 1